MLDQVLLSKLIPHRPPFLLVDCITEYQGGEFPCLEGKRSIGIQESWPEIYTVEGLGQCANILSMLWWCEYILESAVGTKPEFSRLIDNDPDSLFKYIFEYFPDNTLSRIGLLGSLNIEYFEYPVQGDTILYKIKQVKYHNQLSYFSLEARVEGILLVAGTSTGSIKMTSRI